MANTQLSIYFDDTQKAIIGEITPTEESSEETTEEPITPAFIKQKLEAIGYANLSVDAQAVNKLCMAAQRGEEEKLILKVLQDGSFELNVSADKRFVSLTLNPADGGRAVSQEDIKKSLSENNILEDFVDWDAIGEALEKGEVKDLCLAKATSAVDGKDAVYIPLVESEIDSAPAVNEQGVADMLSGHSFTLVEIGEPLMRREPATEGEPGKDVTGQDIKPTPGKDPGFAANLEGADISTDDPNLLIASIKGHPIVSETGVSVDPVLHVDNVDVHTGNISFDGSLEVKGDVAAGMHINVSGDVIVKGVVERAEIKAGNDIVVRGGIFGGEEFKDQVGELEFTIQAGGSVEATFMSLVAVKAEKNIVAKQYIGNCIVEAGEQLLLGQNGGKGILFGGWAKAKLHAAVAQLGNETYIETRLFVGERDKLERKQDELENELSARQKEVGQLEVIFEKLKKQDPMVIGKISVDKTTRIANTIQAIKQRISELESELTALKSEIDSQQDVRVVITKMAYPNASIIINGLYKQFNQEQRGETWLQVGDQIVAGSDKEA